MHYLFQLRCMNDHKLLINFIDCVDWGMYDHASEARCLLYHWEESDCPEDVLPLLGVGYTDPIVSIYIYIQS